MKRIMVLSLFVTMAMNAMDEYNLVGHLPIDQDNNRSFDQNDAQLINFCVHECQRASVDEDTVKNCMYCTTSLLLLVHWLLGIPCP